MAPKKREIEPCQICTSNPSKYTCAQCTTVYCSVPCYKTHKATACEKRDNVERPATELLTPIQPPTATLEPGDDSIEEPEQLLSLTSLKWPYIPEETAFPDPLKRDDPKVLQLPQYEAIATSANVRKVLAKHPNLQTMLRSVDQRRGRSREEALQKALGVTVSDVTGRAQPAEITDDTVALRELAEAIEAAVRGGDPTALGLNWEAPLT